MIASSPHRRIVQINLKTAPYLVCVAGAAVIVLMYFVPLYPALFALAIALGLLSFAIDLLGLRWKAHLYLISTLLTILAWSIARRSLLPPGIATTDLALAAAQFLASWILTSELLYMAFRARIGRYLNERAA